MLLITEHLDAILPLLVALASIVKILLQRRDLSVKERIIEATVQAIEDVRSPQVKRAIQIATNKEGVGAAMHSIVKRVTEPEQPASKSAGKVLILAPIIVVLASGCAGGPTADESGAADLARDLAATATLKGGSSSATNTTNEIPMAVTVGWGGSSPHSNSMSARYSPTNTNSSTAGMVTGWNSALTAEQQQTAEQAVAAATAADPVLQSIAAELKALADVALEGRTPDWTARIDALRESYAKARDGLIAAISAAGVTGTLSLPELDTLVVIGWANSWAGATERPPTDAEAANLARVLSNPISAARGETVVIGKDERVEGETE